MKRLEGKIALITGAARGIGRGVALCMAAEGADIVVNDIGNEADAEATVKDIKAIGPRALFMKADVSNREQMQQVMDDTLRELGRLDIVVANAAMSIREPVLEANWDHILRTLEVSQFGVFHTCQIAAQQMVKQEVNGRSRGKILIIGSVHEELAVAGSAAYNMAKAAINHLARTMATELTAYRINVNVINPGWILTPGELQFYTKEELERAGAAIPWGRIGNPKDIGKAAVFLCSDDADYITGSALRVDGGYVVGLDHPSSVE